MFWPIILGQFAVNTMSVVDTLMAGMAGPIDLSGVAIGSSFFYPVLYTMVGLATAIQPIVSQLVGAKRTDEIPYELHQITLICLFISIFMAIFLALVHLVYNFIPADIGMIRVAKGYLYALSFGIPVMVLYHILHAYCEGLGYTLPTLLFGFLQLALNIPLNYIFIFGHCGMPALGGVGCGVATALTALIATIAFVFYIQLSPKFAHVRLYRKFYAVDFACIKKFLKLGVPLALSATMEMACFFLAALILSPFGAIIVSAHSITLSVSSMFFMFPLSIAIVTAIRVGTAMGARNWEMAALSVKSGFIINFVMYVISVIVLLMGNHFLAGLYSDDETVVALAASLLLVNCLYLLPDSVQMLSMGILRGFKDSKTIFYVTLFAYWIIGMPLGYLLAWGYLTDKPTHGYGIWISFTVSLTVAMIIYLIRLKVLFKTRRLPKAMTA